MAQYKRRNFLINKPFQLRFSLFVCAWVVAMSFIYPLIIQQIYEGLVHYAATDPSAPPVQKLIESKQDLMDWLLAIQAAFICIAFVVSIFVSHRIAGPLYKLRLFMKKAQEGRLSEPVYFREGDYFKELAVEFNEMTREIRKREECALALIDQALQTDPSQSREALLQAKSFLQPPRP